MQHKTLLVEHFGALLSKSILTEKILIARLAALHNKLGRINVVGG